MNENINLSEILKDCPRGWKFYSSVYGEVEFVEITSTISPYPVIYKLYGSMYCVSSAGELFKGQEEYKICKYYINVYESNLIDFYNKNHLDYRYLIEKGLAIDATGLNIY